MRRAEFSIAQLQLGQPIQEDQGQQKGQVADQEPRQDQVAADQLGNQPNRQRVEGKKGHIALLQRLKPVAVACDLNVPLAVPLGPQAEKRAIGVGDPVPFLGGQERVAQNTRDKNDPSRDGEGQEWLHQPVDPLEEGNQQHPPAHCANATCLGDCAQPASMQDRAQARWSLT